MPLELHTNTTEALLSIVKKTPQKFTSLAFNRHNVSRLTYSSTPVQLPFKLKFYPTTVLLFLPVWSP
jgi:hypothetical protein